MLRHLSAFAILLLLAGVPAAATALGEDVCADAALPYALNVGLPQLPDAPGFQASALEQSVQRVIAKFYSRHGRCPERQLQVNITIAGDYEILDWLAQGLIDLAVVPDLTVYLLSRDDINLKEMDLSGFQADGLLLPALRPQPRSSRLIGGEWQWRPDPRADFAAFQEQTWRLARAAGPPAAANPPAPGYRVVLSSHLSSPGFLAPIDEAGRKLEERLGQIEEGEWRAVRERFWQAFFDNTRFAVDCDSLVRDSPPGSRSCWRLPDAEERVGTGPVEVLFPGEGVLRRLAGPSGIIGDVGDVGDGAPGRYRERLVIAPGVADLLFDSGTRDAEPRLPTGAATLFKADPPLPVLASLIAAEPSFGVRTFRFTIDEIFGLLRRHQATSGDRDLALVLPGGGVKAAYQSTVVDALYHQGYLKNFKAEPAPGSAEPMDVEYVIGTSGGALLGFFVSQLGENGPWGLSDILWKKADGSFVESTDIFAWTDLLRYVSVIASFLVLCGLIALVSIPERSPLNPAPVGKAMGVRRPLTLGVLLPVLFLAPLLVRHVNGDSLQEHVPEIEGLLFAILAMIAMVTDQAMVRLDRERETDNDPWVHPALPVALGAVLVLLPLLPWGGSRAGRLLGEPLTFGPAFAVLAPLLLLGGLILPLRAGRPRNDSGRLGWMRPALHFLAAAGLALAAAFLLPRRWLDLIKMPFFLAGFLLVLVSVGANFLLAARTGLSETARRRIYRGALFLSSLLLVTVCWPERAEPTRSWVGLSASLGARTLDVTVGSFLLGIGLLSLMLGGITWVYASRRRYHLRLTEFLVPYFVVLLHAVAVYLVLVVVIALLPDWLSPLELTREFWLWLLATSLVLGILLLLAGLGRLGGRRPESGRRWSAVVAYLHRSFAFLGSHHPNGDVITRRFARMAVWSVCCLGWWNLVVAPALYGNGQAFRYLSSAADQFRSRAGLEGVPYRPTARFIAPANLLEKDGTRYFLFVPEGDECPSIPRRPASGAQWLSYEASFGKPAGTAPSRRCQAVPNAAFLRDVIFASGSPFPIFPAHRVQLDGEERPLVDGGYSNNVPVDVALTVSASQVLIVDSTNPLGHESPPTFLSRSAGRVLMVRGKLVENLGRLPGFLFERSQQVDRLSRRDLFVVSLAPSRDEPDWPPLFDFRQQTVERLEKVARRDLGRRIGMVQSWGRPRFQLSVPVKGRRAAEAPLATVEKVEKAPGGPAR